MVTWSQDRLQKLSRRETPTMHRSTYAATLRQHNIQRWLFFFVDMCPISPKVRYDIIDHTWYIAARKKSLKNIKLKILEKKSKLPLKTSQFALRFFKVVLSLFILRSTCMGVCSRCLLIIPGRVPGTAAAAAAVYPSTAGYQIPH